MKTIYDMLAKIDTNCSGVMTKMATMPMCGKSPFKYLHLRHQKANGLGMGYGPYQVCTYGESRLILTHFMARSNLIPNEFIWEKS